MVKKNDFYIKSGSSVNSKVIFTEEGVDFIKDSLLRKKESPKNIAIKLGLSTKVIHKILKKHNLDLMKIYLERKGFIKNCEICNKEYKIKPSRKLYSKFCSRKCCEKSRIDRVELICKECGESYSVIKSLSLKSNFCSKKCKYRWLGVELKERYTGREVAFSTRVRASATLQCIPLEKWKKFISFEPYTPEFNQKFKDSIKKRDNSSCIKCGKTEDEEINITGRRLPIHHINYDKKLSIKENCCTLCTSCNIEVNKNRKHWTLFFQSLLNERYNYNYDYPKKTVINGEISKWLETK